MYMDGTRFGARTPAVAVGNVFRQQPSGMRVCGGNDGVAIMSPVLHQPAGRSRFTSRIRMTSDGIVCHDPGES
jgi:hypothetical protein